MGRFGNKNYAAKSVLIEQLAISHILPLHTMYDSLSDHSKSLFHPGFLGLSRRALNITWFLAQIALLASCFKPLRKLVLRLYPRAVFLLLVAKPKGFSKIIGFAFVKAKRRLSNGSLQGELGIGIVDEWQGRKVGLELITKLLELAVRQDVQEISLQVRADNVKAVCLYEKFGFQIVNILRDADYWNGHYYDNYQMELRIPRNMTKEYLSLDPGRGKIPHCSQHISII